MALASTIYSFVIDLANADRNVYETLDLRVARHPSETEDYLLTRVLAYCLEYTEGLAFTTGLSTPDTPPLVVRDLTGRLRAWIDVGVPDAARLHKASKAADRVVVYTHKDPQRVLRELASERVHRAAHIQVVSMPAALLTSLVGRLQRRMAFTLSIAEDHLYLSIDAETIDGALQRHSAGAS
jgi:uncharacterized protein YaeQ